MQLNQAPKRTHKLAFLIDDSLNDNDANSVCYFFESRGFRAEQVDEGIIFHLEVMDEDSIVTLWIEKVREMFANILAKTQNNDQTK